MKGILSLIALAGIYSVFRILDQYQQHSDKATILKQSKQNYAVELRNIIVSKTNQELHTVQFNEKHDQNIINQRSLKVHKQVPLDIPSSNQVINYDQSQSQSQIRILQSSTCGNGVIDPGQQCDDGNTNDNDGCDSNCFKQAKISTGVIIVIVVVSCFIIFGGIFVAVKYCCWNDEANQQDKDCKITGTEQHLPSVNHDHDHVVIDNEDISKIKR